VTTADTTTRGAHSAVLPTAALFDMDGLLVDTEPLWFEVESALMAELGAVFDRADHAKLVGSSAIAAATFISERAGGKATPEEVRDAIFARMAKRLRETQELQPGVAELIAELDAAGVPRALVSSSARALIDAAMEGLAPLTFDVVVAGDEVSRNKPHPEPYLSAATLLGVDPAECVAFEDSPIGARSATAAGCVVIAVPSVTAIEPARRRVVVGSLSDVDLAYVRSLFDGG
jgi:HAD superfamily hydrolase (TIGR01509 family)